MRFISNSEVSSWLTCTRKYYYEYVLNLEPRKFSDAISKGILIHAMLEQYYVNKSEGLSESECRAAAMEPIMEAAAKEGSDMMELAGVRDLVMGYFDFYDDDKYEVLSVESKYKLELSDAFALVGTLDLILRDLEDGRIVGVDHKSSYNFWTPEHAQTAAQFSKYIAIMRGLGMDVKSFMVNQIRTRPVKNGDLYKREFVSPSDSRIKAVMDQHIKVSNEIMQFRGEGAMKEQTIPVYDKFVCSNCPFYNLCDSDTEGVNIEYQIQQDFQLRKGYGYN